MQTGTDNAAGYRAFELQNGGFNDGQHRNFQLGYQSGDFDSTDDGETRYGFRVRKADGSFEIGRLDNNDTGVTLFVAKFQLSAAGADTVTVWQNPTLGDGEPAGGVTLTGADLTFDRTTFAKFGDNDFVNFDELRLGTSFDSVTTGDTGAVLGDLTGNGVVDCDDLHGYVGNIGAAATGALAQLDIDGDGTLSAGDANTHITTLVVTSNGVTGTFPGDLNCDGQVNVLGDAFLLVASLNTSVTTYAQGDINFDGTVNVLGDAFALVSNLGMSNN